MIRRSMKKKPQILFNIEAVKKFVVGSVWEKIGSLQIILRQKCVSFGDEFRI